MIKLSVCIPVWNQEELLLKALDHIPRRDDVEVLVRDDGSTDSTLANLIQYQTEHPELNLQVFSNHENHGMYYTLNRLLEDAQGQFFHCHNSDDYVDSIIYNDLIDQLNDDIDVLGFDLRVNDGSVWPLREETNRIHCAQAIRFIRKAFVEGITYHEHMKAAADWYYNNDLLKRTPRIVYSGKVVYMYNFPREGSLVDLRARGIIGE